MPTIIAVWAVVWALVAAGVSVVGFRRGRPLWAAVWLVTIGAFLAAQEDPLLVIQMASTGHSASFHDGVLGLVDPHTRGHMYGAAILALAGLGLTVLVAHNALRRGEAWAWWGLAGFWLFGAAADLYELFGIYPHGFPLAPTPADGVRGFGWQTLAAWILIWAAGLAIAAPSVLARSRRAVGAVAAPGSA
ncbi:MAG TPA: hypothetical protein VKI99_18905 [Candidatus Dormibacteraeota bacterium]|nr:hypothetical protein [Candidatus Dormibacteraeota bacterium]